MTEAKDLQLIFHILKYCERIKKVITFLDNDFNNYIDKKNFTSLDSCSFSAFQIGELVGKLSEKLKNNYSDVPWQKIKGLRNVIVHNYGNIDLKILWKILTKDVEDLNIVCRQILEKNDPNYNIILEEELSEEI